MTTDTTVTDHENEHEEPEDAKLRADLGLRPIYYDKNGELHKGGHPDRSPCPPWCWVGQHEVYEHEMDPDRLMTAQHRLAPEPSIVASLYPGETVRDGSGYTDIVRTATIEPRLEQVGQDGPVVSIAVRDFPWQKGNGHVQRFRTDLLRMTVEDTRELVTALSWILEQLET